MDYSYYPGCTLRTKARELDYYAKMSAKKLGVNLEEVEEWQCCGGVYPMANNEIATRLSSIRTLQAAKEKQQALVTVCSACHHVIKRVNADMKNDENIRRKANLYLGWDSPYMGETKVIHYLELLRDEIGWEAIKKAVTCSLKKRKIAAYYGCLLLRPSEEMQMDDPENPSIMEDLIRALGGTPVFYSQRNECCGGYAVVKSKEFARKRCDMILQSAKQMGAEEIITACPLCMYNLRQHADEALPVRYFTEVLAEALGVKSEG